MRMRLRDLWLIILMVLFSMGCRHRYGDKHYYEEDILQKNKEMKGADLSSDRVKRLKRVKKNSLDGNEDQIKLLIFETQKSIEKSGVEKDKIMFNLNNLITVLDRLTKQKKSQKKSSMGKSKRIEKIQVELNQLVIQYNILLREGVKISLEDKNEMSEVLGNLDRLVEESKEEDKLDELIKKGSGAGFVKVADLKEKMVGSGKSYDPYQIGHPSHLRKVSENLRAHYKVVENLDFSGFGSFIPIGGTFEGVFDGGEKIIKGLEMSGKSHLGLFVLTGGGSVIKNVRLIDLKLRNRAYTSSYVGGLVGKNRGKIENSVVTGTVTSGISGNQIIGGLVGINAKGGIILDNEVHMTVTGSSSKNVYIGGLVGKNRGKIERSKVFGNVIGSDGDIGVYVGGLVGENYKDIENSQSSASVRGSSSKNIYVGGLVGISFGPIRNSKAFGNVYVNNVIKKYIGTLVGAFSIYRSSSVEPRNKATGNIFVDGKKEDSPSLIHCIYSGKGLPASSCGG